MIEYDYNYIVLFRIPPNITNFGMGDVLKGWLIMFRLFNPECTLWLALKNQLCISLFKMTERRWQCVSSQHMFTRPANLFQTYAYNKYLLDIYLITSYRLSLSRRWINERNTRILSIPFYCVRACVRACMLCVYAHAWSSTLCIIHH